MKTTILTTIAIAVLTLSSVSFSYAASKNNTNVTVLSNLGAFNKIEVHGNVELIVANGSKNSVEVNNNYYAENAMIQGEDGVLRIASYNADKLVVYVTANELSSIAAYDNASVKSHGRLSLVNLEVSLNNNAYASLNLDNYAANITVNDQAKANLTGSIVDYNLTYSQSSSVNRVALNAQNTNEILVKPAMAPKHKRHSIEAALNS